MAAVNCLRYAIGCYGGIPHLQERTGLMHSTCFGQEGILFK